MLIKILMITIIRIYNQIYFQLLIQHIYYCGLFVFDRTQWHKIFILVLFSHFRLNFRDMSTGFWSKWWRRKSLPERDQKFEAWALDTGGWSNPEQTSGTAQQNWCNLSSHAQLNYMNYSLIHCCINILGGVSIKRDVVNTWFGQQEVLSSTFLKSKLPSNLLHFSLIKVTTNIFHR